MSTDNDCTMGRPVRAYNADGYFSDYSTEEIVTRSISTDLFKGLVAPLQNKSDGEGGEDVLAAQRGRVSASDRKNYMLPL